MNSISISSGLSIDRTRKAKYCRTNNIINPSHRRNFFLNHQGGTEQNRKTQKSFYSILEGIFINHIKAAFQKIFPGSKKSESSNKMKFLLGQKHTETTQYIPNLLQQVKLQKFQSQINFKVFESQFSTRKVHKLVILLCKLCQRRKTHAIQMLNKHLQEYNAFINKQLLLQELKVETQTNDKYNNNFQSLFLKQSKRTVHISYLKVKLIRDNKKNMQKADSRCKMPQSDSYISIKDLSKSRNKKQYIFHSIDNKLTRKAHSRIIEE